MKKLKILHLTTHLNIGGITSVIQMLGSAMIRKGHSVSVLCSGGELVEDLEKKGFQIICLPIRTKSEFSPKLWWAFPKIVSIVKKEKFDVLHAHTRVTQVLAHFVSKLTGVPVVTTAHGFYKPRFGRRRFGAWGKRVIAISPLVAESLEKAHGVDHEKIRLIPNAIDVADSRKRLSEKVPQALRAEYGIPKDAVVLSSISRFVADKGHAYLVEATNILRNKGKDVFLLMLGDGRERKKLLKLIDWFELSDHVKIVRMEKDITKILAVTDIFVHPATYREGFGLSIAEAMAAGKPIVATDIPAINTLLKNGESGSIVSPKSAEALAGAIGELIEKPWKARIFGENGRIKALELCSLDRMVDGIEEVYRELL